MKCLKILLLMCFVGAGFTLRFHNERVRPKRADSFSCYKCDSFTDTPDECTAIEECTQKSPQCVVRAQKTQTGKLRFNKSCISEDYCRDVEMPKNSAACDTDLNDMLPGEVCVFCHSGSLSNLESPTVRAVEALTCYKCDKFTATPDECTGVVECTQTDAQCSIRAQKTQNGNLLFSKDCISEKYCRDTEIPKNAAACDTNLNDIVYGDTCVFCYSGALSNLETPFVGEVEAFNCYKCDSFTDTPDECTGIEECTQTDPQCSISVQKTQNGNLLYSKACISEQYCKNVEIPNNAAACSTDLNGIVYGESCMFCYSGQLSNLASPAVGELEAFTCYNCDIATATPDDCTDIVECTQTDPQCSIRAQKTTNGHLLFSKACISEQHCINVEIPNNVAACNTNINDIVYGDVCVFCSSGSLSNLENPVVKAVDCYRCDWTTDPGVCSSTIITCAEVGEVCSFKIKKWSNGLVQYWKGCHWSSYCLSMTEENPPGCDVQNYNNVEIEPLTMCTYCGVGNLANQQQWSSPEPECRKKRGIKKPE